jgi:hypothetical protein
VYIFNALSLHHASQLFLYVYAEIQELNGAEKQKVYKPTVFCALPDKIDKARVIDDGDN